MAVQNWLKTLPLAPKTRSQIRALVHLLFERAMLWELVEVERNPIELVAVKGSSARVQDPQTL